MTSTGRIQRLRQAILQAPPIARDSAELLWARAWQQSAGEPWHIIRRARATAGILENLAPVIDADELLVAKFPSAPLSDAERAELAHWRDEIQPALPAVLGQRAHMAIDYDKLLRLGLVGLQAQIERYRAPLDLTRPEDQERDAFYRACSITLDALATFSARYADHAEALAAQETDAPRKAELSAIAQVCRQVPMQPAQTFRQALQALHLVTFSLCAGQQMLLFQLGRPDRYLLPLYERDLASGRLTQDEAQELIDCLCLMLNAYTPRDLAVGLMVGGKDGSGRDVSNELTRLFLQSIRHTRLAYPGIGLCWHAETPEEIKALATELLAEGLTHPALFNDDVITQSMLDAGLPPAEACLYIHSTCVEITPIASSNVYVASPYINLLQLLHDLLGIPGLDGRRRSGLVGGGGLSTAVEAEPVAYPSLEALLAAYEAHLAQAIAGAVVDENACQATRRYHGGFPLLSCFVNDCLARGRDIDHGGARYNWVEPSFVGLANLVDALAVINQLVYVSGLHTLAQVTETLRNDFDDEALRQRWLNQIAKYGNDDDSVDALAQRITGLIAQECRRHQTYLGGGYHPGFFCWVMHERLGAITAASADGRKAGMALGDGSGPAQGREKRGPTAAILSATKWNHTGMLGGIALNLKFARSADTCSLADGISHLADTYVARGGFELQVNVLDAQTLHDAQAHPERYRDLVVRIGGYSAYFVDLPPRMQAELILRTEHGAA